MNIFKIKEGQEKNQMDRLMADTVYSLTLPSALCTLFFGRKQSQSCIQSSAVISKCRHDGI